MITPVEASLPKTTSKGKSVRLLRGVLRQKHNRGPRFVSCVKWASIGKIAYHFEKEIQQRDIWPSTRSNSILVITSTRQKMYELLKAEDFLEEWDNGDACILPTLHAVKQERKDVEIEVNKLCKQCNIVNDHYWELPYWGPWKNNCTYQPGKVVKYGGEGKSYYKALKRSSKKDPENYPDYWEATIGSNNRQTKCRRMHFFHDRDFKTWLTNEKRDGGLANWRLDRSEQQTKEVLAIVFCTYKDALEHLLNATIDDEDNDDVKEKSRGDKKKKKLTKKLFLFDAVIMDENDILAMKIPSRKRSRSSEPKAPENKAGYFENLKKIIKLSQTELCVRVVPSPVGENTMRMEWEHYCAFLSRTDESDSDDEEEGQSDIKKKRSRKAEFDIKRKAWWSRYVATVTKAQHIVLGRCRNTSSYKQGSKKLEEKHCINFPGLWNKLEEIQEMAKPNSKGGSRDKQIADLGKVWWDKQMAELKRAHPAIFGSLYHRYEMDEDPAE